MRCSDSGLQLDVARGSFGLIRIPARSSPSQAGVNHHCSKSSSVLSSERNQKVQLEGRLS